jgi:2-oxo-4-hydroxy-4-carboxy--5-ureidoimidazoline (OHCU) decarboxylase
VKPELLPFRRKDKSKEEKKEERRAGIWMDDLSPARCRRLNNINLKPETDFSLPFVIFLLHPLL